MITALIVCVHNAGRSQMAASVFNCLAQRLGVPASASSAGTQPEERVHPNVVQISMLDVEVREIRIIVQVQFQDNKIPKTPVDVQYTTM